MVCSQVLGRARKAGQKREDAARAGIGHGQGAGGQKDKRLRQGKVRTLCGKQVDHRDTEA